VNAREDFPGSAELADAAEQDQAAWDRMIKRATRDTDYRSQLLADPVSVLTQEGIRVPEGIRVTVHEFDAKHAHFFLPPPIHEHG
jgi:hypothetical protein